MKGRVHRDADGGNFTTTRASVADYFICNAQFVKHFEVLEFNCFYTDNHMPPACQLSCKMSVNNENSKDIMPILQKELNHGIKPSRPSFAKVYIHYIY